MIKDQEKRGKMETKLSDHKREKKKLTPPFLQIGNIAKSSWIDDRLPEMLWAILAIGNLQREHALDFFRHIAKFVESNSDCYDVTLTGISKFSEKKREEFIKHMTSWSPGMKEILRPLLLFPDLPAIVEWKKELNKPEEKVDWEKVAEGVAKTFWHQSQEATDCRWIKIFSAILGGNIKFPRAMEETIREIFEYPNRGDMRKVRPTIRAFEMTPNPKEKDIEKEWPKGFWKYCFDHTGCMPEHVLNKKIENRKKELAEESEKARKHYFDETIKLRDKLIDHTLQTAITSSIDARHEASFGLALYSLTLFIEIVFYRAPLSITGRLALRALAEAQITFAYLLKKEKEEPKVWEDYRGYGTGQAKLIYLKLQELAEMPNAIDFDQLDYVANEDAWIEFTPINLGHWDSTDLRKMSEEVGLKELYDQFYNYTSGYMHANWAAVREAVYQRCINPLHRYHRVPTFDLPLLPSITKDAEKIVNNILEYLSTAYPGFKYRLEQYAEKENDGKKEQEK